MMRIVRKADVTARSLSAIQAVLTTHETRLVGAKDARIAMSA
jgi:hypothetical protein